MRNCMWLHWGKKVPLLWLWLRIWSFFEGEKKKKKRERENGANSKRATTSSVQTPGGPDRRAGVSSTLRGGKKEKQLSPALFLKRTCSTNRSVFLFHKAHCYSLPSLSFFPSRMDFPMYVYKPRRGMKRGEESKVSFHFSPCYNLSPLELFY